MATVKLNVGGTHIEVATDTLNKCEYFRIMLSKNWTSKTERVDAVNATGSVERASVAIFLDCDLDKFTRGVLDPLRYSKDIPEDCLEVADFYGLTSETGPVQKHSHNDVEKLAEYLASFSILYETLVHRYLTPNNTLVNLKKYIDLDRTRDPKGPIYHQFKLDSISKEINKVREEIKCNAYEYKNILNIKLAQKEQIPSLSFTKKDIDNINTYYYLLYNNLSKEEYVSDKNILLLTYTEHYKKLIDILETNFSSLEIKA